jgi:hypothetical protein
VGSSQSPLNNYEKSVLNACLQQMQKALELLND